VPPGVIGAGSEPSASLLGPIVKLEESSVSQRRFRVVVCGLEIQRATLRCGGGRLSRLGPIRSWQLIARYVIPPSKALKCISKMAADPHSATQAAIKERAGTLEFRNFPPGDGLPVHWIVLFVLPFQSRLSSRPSLSLRGSRTRHDSVASPTPTPNASSLPRIVSVNNSVCFDTNERTCASAGGRMLASQRAANCELYTFVTDHRALKCSSTSQAPVHL
jgi:hypothetical protein